MTLRTLYQNLSFIVILLMTNEFAYYFCVTLYTCANAKRNNDNNDYLYDTPGSF